MVFFGNFGTKNGLTKQEKKAVKLKNCEFVFAKKPDFWYEKWLFWGNTAIFWGNSDSYEQEMNEFSWEVNKCLLEVIEFYIGKRCLKTNEKPFWVIFLSI